MDLYEAIAAGDLATVTTMLAEDPTMGASRHPSGPTPVLYALYQRQPAVARALATLVGQLSLAEAAALDEVGRVSELLDAGEPVDGRTPDGFTPLQLAAFFGGARTAALLLGRGADPVAVSANEMRIQPLHAAATGRHREIVVALLDAGADPDARQAHGYTPLMSAAINGDTGTAEALLRAGADPAATADDGKTAADHARGHGQDALADLLGAAAAR